MTEAEGFDTMAVERRLANELLGIHKDSYGVGAGKSRVHVLDDLVVCMLDELELLPNEEFLIERGKGDAVVDVRSQYQQAIETTFSAAVERATGRRVISFASITKLDPNYACEFFRLGDPKDRPELADE
jgi:uncharacterized protein YbcI